MVVEGQAAGATCFIQQDGSKDSQPNAVIGEERLLQLRIDQKRKREKEEQDHEAKERKIVGDVARSRAALEASGMDQDTHSFQGPPDTDDNKCMHCKVSWAKHRAAKTKGIRSIGTKRQCSGTVVVEFALTEGMLPIMIRCTEFVCTLVKSRKQFKCPLHAGEDTDMTPANAIPYIPGSTYCISHQTHHKDSEVKWVGCTGEVKIRTSLGMATVPCPMWRCTADKHININWNCPAHTKKKASSSTK